MREGKVRDKHFRNTETGSRTRPRFQLERLGEKYAQEFQPYHGGEVETVPDPLLALLELVHEAHDVEGVHAVDDGGARVGGAEDGAGVRAPRRRLHLVLAPRVLGVAVPGVLHHLLETE